MDEEYLELLEIIIKLYAVFFVWAWFVFFYTIIRFNVFEDEGLNHKHSIS